MILLLLTIPLSIQPSVGRYIRFEHLIPEQQGETVLGISSILQDKMGFMWFGTGQGLLKYNGYTFTFFPLVPSKKGSSSPVPIYPLYQDSQDFFWIGTMGFGLFRFSGKNEEVIQYQHDPNNPESLSDNIVLAIQEDRNGNLWIGTRYGGLNRLDRTTGIFSRIDLGTNIETVWDVFVDQTNNVWVGTDKKGLFRLNPETLEQVNFRHDPSHEDISLGSDSIWAILEDHEGTVWIGTNKGGLNRHIPEDDTFVRYSEDSSATINLDDHNITALHEDDAGKIWIGTGGGGINIFDKGTGDFVTFRHDAQDNDSLSDDLITSLYQDSTGIMWIGTERGGINKTPNNQVKFLHYKHNPQNPASLIHNDIRAIHQDRKGLLWVGTAGGLCRVDQRDYSITSYIHDPENPNSLAYNTISAIGEDIRGKIWLATSGGGLDSFDPDSSVFFHYGNIRQNPNSLSHNQVNAIRFDREAADILWIGTNQGLDRLDLKSGQFRHFRHDPSDPQSLLGNLIQTVFEDREGNLWIGIRGGGLDMMNKSTGKCQHYNYDTRTFTGNGLNSNTIMAVCEDTEGILWFGTLAGFSRYDILTDQWKNYTLKEGLPGNMVFGILEDRAGQLWLSTNQGISRFDPTSETFTPFFNHDGLQGGTFNPGAFYKTPEDWMLFGGTNGYNSFDPEKIQPNPIVPPIVWTALYKHNQKVDLGRPLSSLDPLEISYKFSFITFEFALLHYANPLMNQFAYLLEGKDSGWNYLGPNNAVSFSELNTGEYTLHVKAANPDGVWNEEGLSIGIRVIPPFWKTGWFIFLVVLASSAFLYSFIRLRKQSKTAHLSFEENMGAIFEKYKITTREQEIIRLILQGASNKDIEKKLFISNSTVRNHIYNIYQKLDVRNRLELIHMIRPSN